MYGSHREYATRPLLSNEEDSEQSTSNFDSHDQEVKSFGPSSTIYESDGRASSRTALPSIGRREKIIAHRRFVGVSILSITIVFLVALIVVTRRGDSPNDASTSESMYSSTSSSEVLSLIASNEYGLFKAPYPWLAVDLGAQLVEPYKLTTLTLLGSAVESGLYSFYWNISGFEHNFVDNSTVQYVTFMETQNYTISIGAYFLSNSSRTLAFSYSTLLISKYVKREIRSLTDDDRERFLLAASTMWQLNSSCGRSRYGSKYSAIADFVSLHSMSSDDIMCDGFHEGTGFLTRHLALTNAFESSLRAIDPSVTLPYWDFSIEGEQIKLKGEKPSYLLQVTPVFSDKWFGSVDEDNHIADSKWAHSLMPTQEDSGSAVRNSYGFIRSYWNNNPDKEVSRKLFSTCGMEPVYKTVPSCSDHFDVLNSPSLGNFLLVAAGDAHGPMHLQIGGLWGGCSEEYATFLSKWGDTLDANITEEFAANYSSAAWKWGLVAPRRLMMDSLIMGKYSQIYKSFWRSHMCAADGSPALLKCPDMCAADVAFEDCACKVDALVEGDMDWRNLLPCMLNKEDNQAAFEYMMPVQLGIDLVTMMASASVKEGEMIQSASPSDIMFWMVHPAIERLLTAKRLSTVSSMGNSSFYKWGENDTQWLEYSYYSFAIGENTHYNSSAYTCEGHAANDTALPSSLSVALTDVIAGAADTDGDGQVSNWEFYQALNPNTAEGNDYVFDNFNWLHC